MNDRYGVILVDPPWKYSQFRDKANGAAKAHYECMEVEDIAGIPVGAWAAPSCVLALWITGTKIVEGAHLALFEAWGFVGKTVIPWIKNAPNARDLATIPGVWFMGNAEYLMFAVRARPSGRPSNPGNFNRRRGRLGVLVGDRRNPEFWRRNNERMALLAPKRAHSRKPDNIQEYLETFEGPFLELFATREREGWDCWGFDTGYELGAFGVRRRAETTP